MDLHHVDIKLTPSGIREESLSAETPQLTAFFRHSSFQRKTEGIFRWNGKTFYYDSIAKDSELPTHWKD